MDNKKLISVVVPCYNEEENVKLMSDELIKLFDNKLTTYDYEIIFIDNDSKDNTRNILREICKTKKQVKCIFNVKNFGQFNSPYYGMLQANGDVMITLACDFQDPVELIYDFVKYWEEGYKIVIGVRDKSADNLFLRTLKNIYYTLIDKLSNIEQIRMFTGFGLYDKKFIDILRDLDDPTPFIRGLVAELGYKRKEVPFSQPKRRAGKSSNNLYSLFDAAMLSVTSYTKVGLRIVTLFGAITMLISLIIAIVYLVLKLMYWERYNAGMIPLLLAVLFLGSVQILFIGLVGEYVLSINQRVMKRPLVIEEERINF